MSRFGLTAKVDTQKQVVNVNPVNNINVNVRSPSDIQSGSGGGSGSGSGKDQRSEELRSRDQGSEETSTSPEMDPSNPYADIYITPTEENMTALKTRLGEMENKYEAFKIILEMYKNNPIYVNKLILVDDVQLAGLVKLLTTSEEVTIDCEDIGEGCLCGANTYRKVNAIYVKKNGNTLNLKYDFPEVTKQLKELGINIKIVW